MPDLPVVDAQASALRLPELNRDDIVRTLTEMRLPEADLSKLGRPKMELPDAVTKFAWPRIDLGSIDVPKALAGVAAAANIGRRARRPRWPLAVGGLIVAGAVVAVLSNEGIRTRLSNAFTRLRDRAMTMRQPAEDILELDVDDPMAFDAAVTAAIEPPPFTETATFDATGYPDGLGADNGDRMPDFEGAKPS
jgi:hypothetical protein